MNVANAAPTRMDFNGYPEHFAIFNNDLNELITLLNHGDLNVMHHDGHTLLTLAAMLNRLQICVYLIDRGADVAQRTSWGVRAICLAAQHGDEALIKLFIENSNADLTLCDTQSMSVCHYAAMNTDPSVMRAVIAAGARLNGRSILFSEPIHIAVAQNENEEVLRLLLAAGADVCSTQMGEVSVLHLAAGNSNANVLAIVIAAGARVDALTALGESACHFAAANNNAAVLEQLLVANAPFNGANRRGFTPCLIACRNPNERVLDLLVAAGASLDVTIGTTVCHAAARNRNIAVLKRLIGLGVDVNARDLSQLTPLLAAAAGGSLALLELLLEAGADVMAVDDGKRNACHFAAYNMDASAMKMLIARGVDFRATSTHNVTPFAIAIEMNNLDVLLALVEAGFDVGDALRADAVDLVCTAAMDMRLPKANCADALRFLLQRGAPTTLFNEFGESVCHSASDSALAELFAFGVNLNVMDCSSLRQLPSHCLSYDSSRMLTLVAAGADVTSLTTSGDSPLTDLDTATTAIVLAAGAATIDDVETQVPPRLLDWAREKVAQRQFELLRLRAFHICVGLGALNLSALEMCEIFENIFAPRLSLVPMHRVWAVVTKIKHWRDEERKR
jgi:ankyrin repeat protein